jgi:hypothetical protein
MIVILKNIQEGRHLENVKGVGPKREEVVYEYRYGPRLRVQILRDCRKGAKEGGERLKIPGRIRQ